MALYDYGNTRLRARLSQLLPVEKLESFTDFKSIDSLISALTKTPYQESIERALTFAHGYECINQAMKFASAEILNDLMSFYHDDEKVMIRMIFFRYDLQNLKVIFRGIIHKIPVDQMTSSFTYMGTISDSVLKDLAKSENPEDAINRMVVFQLPVAQSLLRLRSSKKELTSSDIELAMEKWYFREIGNMLTGNSEDVQLLRKFYQVEADIFNFNTVLRFVSSDSGQEVIGGELKDFLVETGYLRKSRLLFESHNNKIEKLITDLYATRYGPYLRQAMHCYQDTKLLSEFENQMRMYFLNWAARLPRLQPLGIGVAIGYMALKRSEIKNLRWIAKGIVSGFEPAYIRENLERVT